jgi:hypothetical protein
MDSRKGLVFLSVCLAISSSLAAPAGAQTSLGRLSGIVRDSSGATLARAEVTLTNDATNQQQSTVSGSDGRFIFVQLVPGSYTAKATLQGFKTAVYNQVKVDPAQEYSLSVELPLGQLAEVLEVTAGADLVHTTTPEIINTVNQQQIMDLPLNARNPIELIRLQAGVTGIVTRTETVINGGRPSWTQITQDGINIQDNFIRGNALDFVPNRPTSDIVGEFTIVTNTQGVDAAGGASQVKLVTPSGTNQFHGSVYEYNRNYRFSANEWFNNRDGLERPYLNRNQFGATLSGPLIKDKLFFYGYYEAFRQSQETVQNNTLPRSADYSNGIFRYGNNQSANLFQLAGVAPDPLVQSFLLSKLPSPSEVNNSDVGDGVNTGGRRFNQADATRRNYFGGRLDYSPAPQHRLEAIFSYLKETDDRTDVDTIHATPLVYTSATPKRFVGAWNWQISPTLQNELRAGANLAPVDFVSELDYGDVWLTSSLTANSLALGVTHPIPSFQPQGRKTHTYQFLDNVSWIRDRHNIQAGVGLQSHRVNPYNFAGILPRGTFGFSASAPPNIQLNASQFPGGISAADLARANEQLAMLSGVLTEVRQTFQVENTTSGFVPGIPNDRNYSLDNVAVYIQDNWNLRPNLTLRAGLKWEYWTPLREDANLNLLPVTNGRPLPEVVLAREGTLDFVNGGFHKKDLNNFAPAVGLAWDPTKDGKTSIRVGYTKAWVNEEALISARNAANGNPGLDTEVRLSNVFARAGTGIPVVPVPAFKVPRTYADQNALSATSVVFGIDTELKQPSVHQFSVSVERELKWDIAVEARYIGALGRDLYRGVDINQLALTNEYMSDFQRARRNGFLARQVSGVFDPAYNPQIPGSVPLSFIPNFGGGALTNATVRSRIETNQPGALADFYISNRSAGAREAFLPNPSIYAADIVENGAETDYHGLQLELRRRLRNGFSAQVNYTFSKALSSGFGDTTARFEPYVDNARPENERARSPFDVTHIFNGNLVWELPVGEGKRFLNHGGVSNVILGGWRIGSIFHYQSGAPFSILSQRGTVNRLARSTKATANSSLSRDEIKKLLGIRKLPDGRVYYIDPAVLDPSGRAVGPDTLDNSAGFPGQVFFNPGAGELGTMQLLQFDGPSQSRVDLSLIKRTKLRGRLDSELRIDFFNILNHPAFFVDDELSSSASMSWNINNTAFGKVNDINQDPRIVQVSLRLRF